MDSQNEIDKRRHPRKNTYIPASFEVDMPRQKNGSGEGFICNLSTGGALFKIDTLKIDGEPIMRGDRIHLVIEPGDFKIDARKSRLEGKILRFQQNGITTIGVEFQGEASEIETSVQGYLTTAALS